MVKIGVMGASGFVGNRAVEILHEQGMMVCPIVRQTADSQRFTQMGLKSYVANAFDQAALEKAFSGCDVAIHSVLGSSGLIRGSVTPAYRAAQKAGVRRLIYLSSMIVHTSAPAPGTTESTPPIEYQPRFPTHIAKIDAERRLLRLRKKGSVEVVIFRPGVVFGPRSRWITELANQLTQGSAYLIDNGSGVCNTVYVDNLIHAMRLAMFAPGVDGEAFFVGDREQVTWLDFYRPFATALDVDLTQIPRLTAPEFTSSRKQQWVNAIRESEFVQKGLTLLPDELKHMMKSLLPRSKTAVETLPTIPAQAQPVVTEMMAILQQSQYKLPFEKARKILGYEPIFSFEEGCHHSIKWLLENQQLQFHK